RGDGAGAIQHDGAARRGGRAVQRGRARPRDARAAAADVESRPGRERVGKVIADISISLDGFSTGPNVSMDNPIGDGGEGLHTWMFADGGPTGPDGATVKGPQGLESSSCGRASPQRGPSKKPTGRRAMLQC